MAVESWVRWELGAESAGRWMLEALEALGDGCRELGAGSAGSTGRWVLGMLEILGTGCGCWERWLMPAGSTGSWVLGALETACWEHRKHWELEAVAGARWECWEHREPGCGELGVLGCWDMECWVMDAGCWELEIWDTDAGSLVLESWV